MGHQERSNGRRVVPFQETITRPVNQSQQVSPAAGLPGYLDLGLDEDGWQEILFLPIARRVRIAPANAAAEELVTITVENNETITYGALQSRVLLLATGLRRPEKGLIEIPDMAIPKGLGG